MGQTKHRASWMADGSYGVMVHYLITPKGDNPQEKSDDFNRRVDSFDIDYFMQQIADAQADWLIFTIGQCTSYWNSSNTVMDSLVPGRTSRRDIVMEVAQRMKRLGKRFISYLPAEIRQLDAESRSALRWNMEDNSEFCRIYTGFVRAYAEKFGSLNDGWWFDGCYDGWLGDNHEWGMWIDACRAGNPDCCVAFNDGAFCVGREKPVSPLQDYHAGEVHLLEDAKIRFDFIASVKDSYVTEEGHIRTRGKDAEFYMPTSQYVDGVQWHALIPLYQTFNPPISNEYTRYSDNELLKFVSECKKVKGAVTFNVPIADDGHIPDEPADQLQRIGAAISRM